MKQLHRFIVIAGFALVFSIIVIKLQGEDDVNRMPEEMRSHRVLPTSADQVDLLSLFIEPGQLVALPEQALEYSRVADADKRYKELPTFNRFVAETALEVDATLILLSPFVPGDTKAQLTRLGKKVVTLPSRHDLEGVESAILQVGEALGSPRAEITKVIANERKRYQRLQEKVKRNKKDGDLIRCVSYVNYGTGGWGAGDGLSIDFVIRAAGMENAARELKRSGAFEMTFEDLVRLDPDYIVVSTSKDGSPSVTENTLRSNAITAKLRAVKNNRILRLPSTLASASSQEMVTAAHFLHRAWRDAEAKRGQK